MVGPLLTSLAFLGAFAALRLVPGWDVALVAPITHFAVVTPVAGLAALLALGVGDASRRLRNAQGLALALAFGSLAVVFLAHGLSTPGLLLPPSRLPGALAQLSLTLFALLFAWATVPADLALPHPLGRRLGTLMLAWNGALVAGTTWLLADPARVRWLPIDLPPLRWGVAAATLALLLLAGWRFGRAYRFSKLPLQRVMSFVAGWLAVAQVSMALGPVMALSWWLYHVLLLAAVVLLVVGAVRQFAAGGPSAALEALFSRDAEVRLEHALSPSVRALIVAVEARDPTTAGHSRRVALHALRLGEVLGLGPDQLRALGQGGMVHDVGKLEVPDAILNKPEALSNAEYAVIREHAARGHAIGRRLGLPADELQVIRHHHERWDGKGYPDRLAGPAIPRLARILAVADVYDALTSLRSYRAAWEPERARRHIVSQAGRAFDPEVVDAFLRVMDARPASEALRATLRPPPQRVEPAT